MGKMTSLGRFVGEAARAIRNHDYEQTDSGIYFPKAKVTLGGSLRHTLIKADGERDVAVDPNLLTTEGLNYILSAALGGGSQQPSFYLAPFSGNVSPQATWTAANFKSNATEFVAYTASNRLAWTPGAVNNKSIGNSGNLAGATATFSPGGPYTLYGVGLLTAPAKEATTGVLIAAVRFGTPRTGMANGDKLAFEYVLTAADGT